MALNNISILLVEDDPVFRSIMAAFLTDRGAKVVEAEDGESGLCRFQQQSFDIVLADLSMPKMGGLEMLKSMNQRSPVTPSIVISGNNVMADVVEALKIGANDYIVKPVSDLYAIEQAIVAQIQSNEPQISLFDESTSLNCHDEMSYRELGKHFTELDDDADTAHSVQQQLFPKSKIEYAEARIDYTLFYQQKVSAYFIDSLMVDSEYLIFYMVHFEALNNQAAFASVFIHNFVEQKLKKYQNNSSKAIIEPFNMLSFLNEGLLSSGLDFHLDVVYVTVKLSTSEAQIARSGSGLRCYIRREDDLTPLAMGDSLKLGVLEWGNPSIQNRTISANEQFCISTHHHQHKHALINDEFQGVVYNQHVPQGGFVQLSLMSR